MKPVSQYLRRLCRICPRAAEQISVINGRSHLLWALIWTTNQCSLTLYLLEQLREKNNNKKVAIELNIYEFFCEREITLFLFKQMSGFISISLLRLLLWFGIKDRSVPSLLLSPIIILKNCKTRKLIQSNRKIFVNTILVQLLTFTY